MRKIFFVFLMMSIFLTPSSARADFSDVPNGSEYYIPIQELEAKKLISRKNGFLRPNEVITRAEVLKLIFTVTKPPIELETSIEKPFSDVGTKRWFTPYVATAKKIGMIQGRKDGKFYPEEKATVLEGLVMLMNLDLPKELLHPSEDLADDIRKDEWFSPYMAFALETGILTKTTKNMVNPGKPLTRGKMLDMLYRALNDGNAKFGRASYYSDYFEGRGTASGEKFTQNKFTAAHRTLPFGTRILVRNLKNGHTVEVFVNDRGPYSPGLTLDLSKTAFERLDLISSGIIPVEYKILK